MSDNPFAEPDDADRTIIRPVPGGRRPAAPPAPPSDFLQDAAAEARIVQRPPPVSVAEGAESLQFGASPLAAAAAPLLQLLARLRNTVRPPDAGDLRERAVQGVRAFERAAREGGVPMEQLRPAHYALCAALDDVVLNTPWGSTSSWEGSSLVSTFHQEVRAGERFFDILAQVRQHPGRFLPVLELMYLCLSLGFQGRYRLSPRGPAELERLREETYALIMRNRPAAEPELSPHWRGVAAPYRPRRGTVPLWAAAASALFLAAALFVWSTLSLNAASDELYARMLAAPPDHMPRIARAAAVRPPPPPPPAAEPTSVDRLRTFLKPEIDEGLVAVLGTATMPVVRIRNRGMFPSGSATVQTGFLPLLERIGRALHDEAGAVQVVGYTDDQPIRTVRFPSNFQLSAARAEAAREVVLRTLGDPGRIRAEGRGEADPIASNATPDGRELNRRIEIVLRRPS